MTGRAFLVFFFLQTLSMSLWYWHELTGLGTLQAWIFVFLLALISFGWPVYLRHGSAAKLKFKTMVGYFILALSGILLSNLVWMFYWYTFVRRSETPVVWSDDLIVIELFLLAQISICALFYWLSMLVFSRMIARGLRHLRETDS